MCPCESAVVATASTEPAPPDFAAVAKASSPAVRREREEEATKGYDAGHLFTKLNDSDTGSSLTL